ncbi:MAG: S1 RNA-binding domain-containing protein [Lachnospiraceae bacterium]|nr:S1 RNA-binding domain-containing protein [Lachnospiraceae bacterium]
MEKEIKKDIEELAEDSVNFYEEFNKDAADKDETAAENPEAPEAVEEAAGSIVETVETAVEEAPHEEPAPAPEPAESMEDYKEELEKSFRQIHVGDVLEGTVIDVDETGVLMDLEYYAPGRIPVEEMSADPHFDIMDAVRIGDRYQATVKKRDDGRGNIILSKKDADVELSWDKLRRMQEEKTVITGKITETVRGGAILYVEGIRGFIPASKLALTYVEDPETYLHKIVDVQVADVDEEGRRLVLSAKELLIAKAIEEKNKRIERLAVGHIVEGTVENIKEYGAFVNIGDGISGLLHISQISNQKIKHPGAVLREGDKVKVMITKVQDGKVSLSMKAVQDLMAKELQEEEENEYHDGGEAVTSLGDLLKGFKFN